MPENDTTAIKARIASMTRAEQQLLLFRVLTRIRSWWHWVGGPVKGRPELDPVRMVRTNPRRARQYLDTAIVLVETLGLNAGAIDEPMPPFGGTNWACVLSNLSDQLQGENLTPIAEVQAAEAERERQQKMANDEFNAELRQVMDLFLSGEIDFDRDQTNTGGA